MAQLASTKPTKFTDVIPGSPIRIRDSKVPGDTGFTAIALDVVPEHGPHALPLVSFMREGSTEVESVAGSGRWEIDVVSSAGQLAVLAAGVQGVVSGASKPVTIRAIQFRGGSDSARDCVLVGSGLAAIRFDPNHEPPRLLIGGLNPDPVMPGDWIVIESRQAGEETVATVRAVSQNDFVNQYDVDGAA